jgi:thiamine-phosphate pyrophosphorylase
MERDCGTRALRYAITDGAGGSAADFAVRARAWAAAGVDFVQVRETAMPADALLEVVGAMRSAIADVGAATKLLVNARMDVAVAAGADGVHLTSRDGELKPAQVRLLYEHAGLMAPVVSVSCHAIEEVQRARSNGADLILFGPVFEKRVEGERVREGTGLRLLRAACMAAGGVPVLALGGMTRLDEARCVDAGASGLAGIRLFAAMLGDYRDR